MDITTVFGTVIGGSNPSGSTSDRVRELLHAREACLPAGRDSKEFSLPRSKRGRKLPAAVAENPEGSKGGYSLMVGHVLAKDEVGVRFSLSAQ